MIRILLVGLPVVLASSSAWAQIPDHLKCYEVRDPLAKSKYAADLGGLAPEPGCVIRTPAELLCVATTKTNVIPEPPGSAAGRATGPFVCYKADCPEVPLPPVPIADQFGTRELVPVREKLVCAPVDQLATSTCGDGPHPMCGGTCPPGYMCTTADPFGLNPFSTCYCGGDTCPQVNFSTCGDVCNCPPPGSCRLRSTSGTFPPQTFCQCVAE